MTENVYAHYLLWATVNNCTIENINLLQTKIDFFSGECSSYRWRHCNLYWYRLMKTVYYVPPLSVAHCIYVLVLWAAVSKSRTDLYSYNTQPQHAQKHVKAPLVAHTHTHTSSPPMDICNNGHNNHAHHRTQIPNPIA